jgi:hypothetical protein
MTVAIFPQIYLFMLPSGIKDVVRYAVAYVVSL